MARLAPTSLSVALGRPGVGQVATPLLRLAPSLPATAQVLTDRSCSPARVLLATSAVWAGARRTRSLAHRAAADSAAEGPKPKVVFVIGGPGSGKGTQCEFIREMGFTHLSAGELLREERQREGSELGAEIEAAMTSGKAVPSEVIAKLLEQAMRERGAWSQSASFVVDGYPRSEEQLRGWQTTLSSLCARLPTEDAGKVKLLCCLYLEVEKEEMRRRLLSRAENSTRVDDNEEVIEKRLSGFQADTEPLLKFFEDEGQLCTVDGSRAPQEVFADVQSQLAEAPQEA
ncbi:unnamed protein product [Symbiodinium sp. CCMP2456]|nr:unnamed protein product [Symbiodinium sp. CCMP2456]